MTRVGQIVGAFGLKGQVKIEPLTDFESRFAKGSRLKLRGEWTEIEGSSIHKGRPLLKFKGVDDISAAEALQWEYLEASGQPELDPDQYFTADLIGLEVFSEEGARLGPVDDVLPYPAQDVLQIGELLVPMVKEFVKEIDLDAKRIKVRLIPGMLPE